MSIFGIAQSANTLVNDIKNIFSFGDQGFSITNDSISRAVQEINDELWNENPGYGFCVSKSDDPFKPSSSDSEFTFQINPSAIRMDEDFSVVPRATQTGVIVEHEGFVFKKITISGTTGIQPKKGIGGVTETGQVQLGGGHSGYHEFGLLINFIRAYAEFKADPAHANIRLVFKNFKDNEYWFVEPLRFTKQRDGSKPHMSQYDISLIVTGKAVRKKSAFENFFGKITGFIDTYITGPLNAVQKVMEDSVNLLLQVEGEVEHIIFAPLQEAIDTMDALGKGIKIVSGLPRSFYTKLKAKIKNLGDSVADLFGYNNPGYDAFYGRSAVQPRPAPEILTGTQVSLLNAFLEAETILDRILSTDSFFEEPTTNKNTKFESSFSQTSIPTPTTTEEHSISKGDNLERIASRTLGSSDRMLELITLNNLEPPYIDPTGTSTNYRVKNPGDKLLIPTFSSSPSPSNKIDSKSSALTKGLSALEKSFGVDLKLSKDFDLIFNNRHDYDYSYGTNNALQAIAIQLNLEKGSLPVNPELGLSIGIGEKTKSTASETIRDIRSTILQDPRFSGIEDLKVTRENGKLEMKISVLSAMSGQPVPIRIALS